LKIAFLLKRHLDSKNEKVYLMRGSGISSFIFYAMGLNKVNPLKFGLDYKNFWNN
jgi:DNA polymerase III alpha subunit